MVALKDDSMEVHYIGSYQMHPDRSMDGSVLAFLNCTDGSVLAFLNCTDGSVLTHLNGSYGSVLTHLRFPTQSGLTRFPQSGISLVPWLLCKKSNKKPCLK